MLHTKAGDYVCMSVLGDCYILVGLVQQKYLLSVDTERCKTIPELKMRPPFITLITYACV